MLGVDGYVHHFPIELTKDDKFYIGKYSFESLEMVVVYYSENALMQMKNSPDLVLGEAFREHIPNTVV